MDTCPTHPADRWCHDELGLHVTEERSHSFRIINVHIEDDEKTLDFF